MERVLPDEDTLVEKLELTAVALSNKANIEYYFQQQMEYEEWERKAELRKGIRLTLLDRCNAQVKKVLTARHNTDEVE